MRWSLQLRERLEMKKIFSYSILGLGIFVCVIGVYVLVSGGAGMFNGNVGARRALVIGAVVIGFWFAAWTGRFR